MVTSLFHQKRLQAIWFNCPVSINGGRKRKRLHPASQIHPLYSMHCFPLSVESQDKTLLFLLSTCSLQRRTLLLHCRGWEGRKQHGKQRHQLWLILAALTQFPSYTEPPHSFCFPETRKSGPLLVAKPPKH